MVNTQSDINIKNVLDKKSTIITKRTWGSWNCNNRQSGDQNNYDLFCKFLEFPNDQDTNDKILPDLLDCVDIGVKYKEKKKKHILGKINKIASAELCRQKCSDTDGCRYWTWIPKKKKKVCTLIKKIKNTGFRQKKDKAVSGTMIKGCDPKGPNKRLTFTKGTTCIDPRGIQGECNFLYDSQCANILRAVQTLGVTAQVRRFLQLAIRSPCGFEPGQADYTLCCVPTTPPTPPGISQDPEISCGISDTTRVVGGEAANLNEWPWAAALGVPESGDKLSLRCGGTLINKDYVLTAAHCFFAGNNNPTMVRLSDLDITSNRDGATHEDVMIQSTIIHPSYDRDTQKNDIALAKLERSVTFRRGLRPACLPERFRGFPLDKLNNKPFVIGWGKTENNQPISPRLLEAAVPLVDNTACSNQYGSVIAGLDISSTQICAGDDDRDSCSGDSGGPLLSRELDNGKWSVIGVVSFGAQGFCADKRFPGVYTRVDKYLDWIVSNTK